MPGGTEGGGVTTEVERGWSSGADRKFWRFLGRSVPSRRLPLRGAQAVASITFDDIPDNAATVGAPILERFGARGTFYVAAAICGSQDRLWRTADRAQLRDLAEAGHELGCHTAHHVNVQSLRGHELARECDRNGSLIAKICGRAPVNFCYPFGDFGLLQKRYLGERFDTCRSIYEHANVGSVDPSLLGAIGLFDAVVDRARIEALVRGIVERRGWLVFYTHDVSPEPTFMGSSPRLLEQALSILGEHGVPVLTMAEAAEYHGLVRPDRQRAQHLRRRQF